MINALICGICGKMGANLLNLLENDSEMQVVCGVDVCKTNPSFSKLPPIYTSFNGVKEKVDVIVDFSSPAVLKEELLWAEKTGCPVVLATTGYGESDLKLIENTSKNIAIFKTGNFSLGINLLVKLVKRAAEVLGEGFDVEIIERHHNLKVDAPSGTALMLADSVKGAYAGGKDYIYGRNGAVGKRGKEIGLHAVRGGTIVGEHEVMFAGEDEIITLSHSARSKKVFAVGAIRAAKWLVGKPAGKYDMNDVLENL